ncbi:MAG: hypothetical protein QOF78_249 [Phycisphaerales bacterium]|jgi:protein-disulfide isomerase|nr:hypothetical protein [Phycisphaerales bacterium]
MLDPGQTATLKTPVDERRDHIRGPRDAAVTLVEYGDFECPHCGRAHFILQDLEAMMGDRYRLVFRNFPLSQIHPYAERAAEAAEAAGAQGLFWEMHDTLFEHQDALEDEDLVAYADEIGCDLPRFQMDLLQGRFRERVREDFLGGVRSGVNGTPTFFINGRRHDAPWDLDALAEAIEMAAMTQGPGGADDRGGRHL